MTDIIYGTEVKTSGKIHKYPNKHTFSSTLGSGTGSGSGSGGGGGAP